MSTSAETHELMISRFIPFPPEQVFRAWTDPALIVQWFTPAPWRTVKAESDVRAGGASYIEMRGPNGEVVPNRGVYLEVVPNRKLVFTDAFTEAWLPSGKAFMLGELTFTPEGDGTRYVARVRHWSAEDKEAHAQMGFEPGWNAATDQMIDMLTRLSA
jgi:uncharacterized protein YndB with AHSA1/START domain